MNKEHYRYSRFEIADRNLFKMPILFEGMMFSGRSPTDIDASMDINGEWFIFYEVKTHHSEMAIGQARHLKSLCDGLIAGGKKATALVVDYDGEPAEGIPLKACKLRFGCGTDIDRLSVGMTAQEATAKLLQIWKGKQYD